MNPETAARAAKLGVLVDTQPAWHYKDADALATGLGRGRLAPFIGLQTWRKAGVDVAINTDHMFGVDPDDALNPFNPFLTMYSAVSRRTESGSGDRRCRSGVEGGRAADDDQHGRALQLRRTG